jgi:isopenicillin N synthase-like dioxygenase
MPSELPTVDLKSIPEDEATLVKIVDHACRVFSTFLVDPCLPGDLHSNMRKVAAQFFALSTEDKLLLHRPGSGLGYLPERAENLAATIGIAAPPDPKESFNIGPNPSKNRWPSGLPEFEETFLRYYGEMERISRQLMRLLSLALGMPANFLESQTAGGNSILRATRYPPLERIQLPTMPLRTGPHTDYGMFSLVKIDPEVGGFEIKPPGEDWTEVKPAEDLFAVNIGDLLMRWTNGLWPATLHRVTAPAAYVSRERLSMVFLHNPSPDTLVAPLRQFIREGESPRFEPVNAIDYLKTKSKLGLGKY